MKKSKKFVLAALALLAAITMVLLPLAGCKTEVDTSSPQQEQTKDTNDNAGTGDNDSTNTEDNTSGGGDSGTVPETPAAKLVSISVTPPEQTVYSVGQEFDPTGMVVTATYNAGEPKDVTSLAKTDFDFSSAGVKPVTVSYKEEETTKTTTFTVTVFPKEVKVLTNYTSPHAPSTGTWTYVEFGDWPQTIKDASVNVYETKSKEMGMFTYYLGSDENYYVKVTAKPYEDPSEVTYTYSDGKSVEKDEEVYFKVEPIKWRVLNKDYASTGKVLLLAESILTGGIPYYVDTSTRPITGAGTEEGYPDTVYPNNWQYSTVRAWLNGRYESDDPQDKEYAGKGFLQTAFTESAQNLIADTTVENTAASTTDTGINLPQATDYACANTTDKIFLLSQQEATTLNSGFGAYDDVDSARIRVTTDYAKATGAGQSFSEGNGGVWWLRSPRNGNSGSEAGFILINGGAIDSLDVNDAVGGVVPALSISLQ